jgi:hypothetical protein
MPAKTMDTRVNTVRYLSFIQIIVLLISITFVVQTVQREEQFRTLAELLSLHKILNDKAPLRQYEHLNAGLSPELADATISQIFLGILNGQFLHKYIFDIPVSKGHHIIVRVPEFAKGRSVGFYFRFFDAWTPIIERNGIATTDVHGNLMLELGEARYEIDDIEAALTWELLQNWGVVEFDAEEAFLLAKKELLTRRVSIPVLQIDVPASLALLILAVLSVVITGMTASNLRVMSTELDFDTLTEPWALLDSWPSKNRPWFDNVSVVLEKIGAYVSYPVLVASPVIVTFMYAFLIQQWSFTSIILIAIITLFSIFPLLSCYLSLYRIIWHFRKWSKQRQGTTIRT